MDREGEERGKEGRREGEWREGEEGEDIREDRKGEGKGKGESRPMDISESRRL